MQETFQQLMNIYMECGSIAGMQWRLHGFLCWLAGVLLC